MPDTVVPWLEQLATQYRQHKALNFTFGLGVLVGDLPRDPENEFNNDTRSPIVRGVAEQDVEKQTEYNDDDDDTNDWYSRDTDEANCIGDDDNQIENADGGVPQEEPLSATYRGVLVEDVPLE